MAKTAMIRARVEPELKRQVDDVFTELGLSATEAITLFYKQIVIYHGLPFRVRVPNAATIEALADVANRKDLVQYLDFDELVADIG